MIFVDLKKPYDSVLKEFLWTVQEIEFEVQYVSCTVITSSFHKAAGVKEESTV